jgi:molybdate transport system substrate-binding protein
MSWFRGIVPILAMAAVAVGCRSGDAARSAAPDGGTASGSAVTGMVTVFAAASLTESFNTLAKKFEALHPGVKVRLDFGASSALALQITQGAPADVFASASTKNMTQVVDAKAVTAPVNFARNVMQIAVPPANRAGITNLTDLARPGVKVALCQSQVPCGATAEKVFSNADLKVKAVTLEPDVKSALTKVETDEVDAAVVYVTDVRAAGSKVRGIEIPDDLNASTEYPIAALNKAANPVAAQAFVSYVRSPAGRQVLTAAGFGTP